MRGEELQGLLSTLDYDHGALDRQIGGAMIIQVAAGILIAAAVLGVIVIGFFAVKEERGGEWWIVGLGAFAAIIIFSNAAWT